MHPCDSCALEYFFTGNGENVWHLKRRHDLTNSISVVNVNNNNNNFNKLSRGFFRITYNGFLKVYIIVILRKNTNLIYNLI